MATKFGLGRGLSELQSARGTIPDISLLTPTERVVVKKKYHWRKSVQIQTSHAKPLPIQN